MATSILNPLFGYKAWADSQLLALISTLPSGNNEELHSCIRTMNHIYIVDRIFRAHLAGEQSLFDATNTKETPLLTQLRDDVAATDAWYVNYVASLSPSCLSETIYFRFTDGDAGRMSREEILLHITTHGGYHRGNVGQMLKSISVAPSRDLYSRFLHLGEPARRVG